MNFTSIIIDLGSFCGLLDLGGICSRHFSGTSGSWSCDLKSRCRLLSLLLDQHLLFHFDLATFFASISISFLLDLSLDHHDLLPRHFCSLLIILFKLVHENLFPYLSENFLRLLELAIRFWHCIGFAGIHIRDGLRSRELVGGLH